jgi:hypothetical protein
LSLSNGLVGGLVQEKNVSGTVHTSRFLSLCPRTGKHLMKIQATHSGLALLMNFRDGDLPDPLEASLCGTLGASVADLFEPDSAPSAAKKKPKEEEEDEEDEDDEEEDEEEEEEEEEAADEEDAEDEDEEEEDEDEEEEEDDEFDDPDDEDDDFDDDDDDEEEFEDEDE